MIKALAHEAQEVTHDGIHLCPICRKLFLEERALYRHVVHVHEDRQYLSYNLRADLYDRWKDRNQRGQH